MSQMPYKTVVVTGATSGIGYATVKLLRHLGFTVFAIGRNTQALAALVAECGAHSIEADVRDTQYICDKLSGVEVDILVNNAGILSTNARFDKIDPAEIDQMIDVNLKAPMQLTRSLLPGMVERKRGHLIYLGSSGGQAAYPSMGAYGPSKAGLSLFCDNLRCDLLGTSVRVSEIVPGRVQTELYKTALGIEEAQKALYNGYRPLQPDHIALIISQVIALPTFVDVARVEVFPTDQATGGGSMVQFEAH
ncbi:SDR family oxidoreductase [Pseudochrobactrum sp. MP213Fo]|uniref:SDR family oxidoreductase n=1 Tax=Pseudochrobactrum sp. MP213Fo TaxID=3022250 RepID=UPI003B9FCFDA